MTTIGYVPVYVVPPEPQALPVVVKRPPIEACTQFPEINPVSQRFPVVSRVDVAPPLNICNRLHEFAVVVPNASDITGVVPPDDWIGYVPVTVVTGGVPFDIAVTSPLPFTVTLGYVNVPTLELTVASVSAEEPGPDAVPSPVSAVR